MAWSPDGLKLASACKNSTVIYNKSKNITLNILIRENFKIIIWDPETGKQIGKPLTGHRQWVTYLSWQPFHL